MRLFADRIRPLVGEVERQVADVAARGKTMDEQRPVVYQISLTERIERSDRRT